MSFTATQFLTKFTTISTATTFATLGTATGSGGYKPSASTAAQVYSFSVANVATSNKRAYVDIQYEDGAGNTALFIRQMPIDPGGAKTINVAMKHIIGSSGYISGAITSTGAPCAFILSIVEIT